MTFMLTGFNEKAGIRHFAFNCVADNRSRSTVIVRTDVSLVRKHQIRLQELPLLCVRLLESIEEGGLAGPITLTEDHMIAIQTEAQRTAEKKPHKPPRRPSQAAGQAWRNTHL